MQIYRLTRKPFSRNLEGFGSKQFGGRWNHIGIPCIYAAESRALAILEYAANTETDEIPRNLSITTYEVPESEFKSFNIHELPGDWQFDPSPQSTRNFGSKFFEERDCLGVKLPSIIVNKEYNYLINPLSEKMPLLKILDANDYSFDIRIKR